MGGEYDSDFFKYEGKLTINFLSSKDIDYDDIIKNE